jgi:TonB-dependent SusC/RagA subfamily outer membrane receptor
VSSQTLSHRASLALVVVFIATTLACASGKPKDMPLQPAYPSGDSAAMANEGKSIEDLFEGKFPGVTVIRADNGGLLIRIRGGSNTFYGSNEPLYVVDDMPLAPGSRGIVFLAPQDIAKIEVLKNPADIGLYGVRGGNGVIKITTRRPGR